MSRPCLSLIFALLCLPASAQTSAQIVLPEPFAVEMPAGAALLPADSGRLYDLLTAASAGKLRVTSDLNHPVGTGPTSVTFTARDGARAVGTRKAALFVLPSGFAPVGRSADENATAGNNAAHIVSDSAGRVHMIWTDSGRQGALVGAKYRRARIDEVGAVVWETAEIPLAGEVQADWNAYPALAVDGEGVDFVWQNHGHLQHRRLAPSGGALVWGAIHDTGLPSDGRDTGPSVVTSGNTIAAIVPSGAVAISRDAGQSWTVEKIAILAGERVKTASLARGADGTLHAAMSVMTRQSTKTEGQGGGGGYWQLLVAVRSAAGEWSAPNDVLAGLPSWAPPPPNEDALADWVRIEVDAAGAEHLAWHGTAVSREYGHDQSWYARRGSASEVLAPVALAPTDMAHGVKYSFAPSLTLDGDHALLLTFFDVFGGDHWAGFDSQLVVFGRGKKQGTPLPITEFSRRSIAAADPRIELSARFPSAAPKLRRGADGHVWLDVLHTLKPLSVEGEAALVVYQRVDLTAAGM